MADLLYLCGSVSCGSTLGVNLGQSVGRVVADCLSHLVSRANSMRALLVVLPTLLVLGFRA